MVRRMESGAAQRPSTAKPANHDTHMIDALIIREIQADEFHLLWPTFHAVVAAGDTYSYSPDTGFDEAQRL
jgi:hypothetical protein